MRIRIIGSSAAYHYPRDDCECNQCKDPINQRRKHSSIKLNKNTVVDIGEDYGKLPSSIKNIIITHCHSDHAYGIKFNLDKNLYMSKITYEGLLRRKLVPKDKEVIILNFNKDYQISDFTLKISPVLHSIICPNVILKIDNKLLYCSDIRKVLFPNKVYKGATTYIGDGASLWRDVTYGKMTIGHLSMINQMKECKKYGVQKVYFIHIGHCKLSHNELNQILDKEAKKIGLKYAIALKEGDIINI